MTHAVYETSVCYGPSILSTFTAGTNGDLGAECAPIAISDYMLVSSLVPYDCATNFYGKIIHSRCIQGLSRRRSHCSNMLIWSSFLGPEVSSSNFILFMS